MTDEYIKRRNFIKFLLCGSTTLTTVWPKTGVGNDSHTRVSFFNNKKMKNKMPLKYHSKWQDVTQRHLIQEEVVAQTDSDCKWLKIKKYFGEKKISYDLISEINYLINTTEYRREVKDFWKTPWEFLNSFGDCEDFA